MSETLQRTLELTRLELLDMGLRGNTLLNLRHTAATVPVVNESSGEVFRLLVLEQQALRLLAAIDVKKNETQHERAAQEDAPPTQASDGEPAAEPTDEPANQAAQRSPLAKENNVSDTSGNDARQSAVDHKPDEALRSDLYLQTQLGEQALDQRLVKISNSARGYYEEQGVEILFLALGCLHWSEDASGRTTRRAPLILVPVELQRTAAGQGFKLVYTGADLGPNLTLAAKLKSEFHLELPPFEEDGFAVMPYLDAVAQIIASRENWCVQADEICLGFFSFGKFQMYQDLDPDAFAIGGKPWEHPLVRSLLADGFEAPDFQALTSPELTALNFVKDSDTSQTEAALAVAQGASMVIQGPPGTGKSQTITNIIAELLARGKTVLFVAEKMAALEVVKRRLDECHLGEAVLELHSHKSRRKAVVEELSRTLEVGVPQTPDRSAAQSRHQHLQQLLDTYQAAVREPVLQSGIDYVEALGAHLLLSDNIDIASLGGYVEFEGMRSWAESDFEQAGHQVAALVAHLREYGCPGDSPWHGTELLQFSPALQRTVQERLSSLHNAIEAMLAQIDQFTSSFVDVPLESLTAVRQLVDSIDWLRKAPPATDLPAIQTDLSCWSDIDSLQKLIVSGKTIQAVRTEHGAMLLDQAWDQDVLALRGVWATTGERWWRLASGDFRQARRTLQSLLKGDLPEDAQTCVRILDAILTYQSSTKDFERQRQSIQAAWGADGDSLEGRLGVLWRDTDTDWEKLERAIYWLHTAVVNVQRGVVSQVLIQRIAKLDESERVHLWENLDRLSQQAGALNQIIESLLDEVDLKPQSWSANVDGLASFEQLQGWLLQAQAKVQDLYALSRFNLMEQNLDNPALYEIARRARTWGDRHASSLLKLLEASWYDGLVREAYASRPVIARFDRAAHEHAVAEFASLDKELFVHAQERLVCQLHERLPSPVAVGEMAILRREMNKKRRHMALRQLISVAGRVIQQIKPVFMMSPMSVATYLEHGSVEFDVVIFDEASQVRVADALGALLRGRQAVVVGDSRQMPPTDFFNRTLELDDEQAEQSQTSDIESILGMFVAQGAPQKMLRWHYRSRHDSLIAVSNEAFYEGKLLIFPTPGIHPRATGLRMRYLPQTHYDRGGSRTNPGEAQALASAVMEHARLTPELSLGVVAFSTAQRDCLLLEIERLRRLNPALEPFFNTSRDDGENFFVKNLENVQGDERDVILISIGYGRTQDGHLIPSFGPINNEGGERRLNVLITRAKLAMEVFCNFTADDLQVSSNTPFGVRALEQFLRYAQTRSISDRTVSREVEVGAFEQYLCEKIRDLGFDPHPRLGQSGFYIDIAVQDPHPDHQSELLPRYALAIQTDGASYQNSRDTRERERVRAGVLGAFGWQLHSVWSTDWFRSPASESERLRHAIEAAVVKLHETSLSSSLIPPTPVSDGEYSELDPAALTESGGSGKSETGVATDGESFAHGSDEHDTHSGPSLPAVEVSESSMPENSEVRANPPGTVTIERLDPVRHAMQTVPVYQVFAGDLKLPRHQTLQQALPESLSQSIRILVSNEGSMHVDMIARRLADEAGVSRLTIRVTERIRQGIAYGVKQGELFQQGLFVHSSADPDVLVRNRAKLPVQYRNIDYISPFELRAALLQVIGQSFGITDDEAISVSLALVGFQRVSAKSRKVVRSVLDEMIKDGLVRSSRGKLSLA